MSTTKEKKWKKTTAKEFSTAKLLVENGISRQRVADILGKSPVTIGRMVKHETLEQYRDSVREGVQKVTKPTTEKPENLPQDDIVILLQNINDTLSKLETRLRWVEENTVVSQPKKFRW